MTTTPNKFTSQLLEEITKQTGFVLYKKKDGGPAFPRDSWMDKQAGLIVQQNGMSLRDWFAGQALSEVDRRSHGSTEAIAMDCYQIADALIAAREKGAK